MAHAANQILVVDFRYHINNVTGVWTDVKYRRANLQDVIDLARMNNTGERVPHHNHMQVRGRKRACQFTERLVRQTKNISQLVSLGVSLHFFILATAAYKTKRDVITFREFAGPAK